MREFKFRAWDDRKMYYQVRCGGMFDGIPTAPTVWIESIGDWTNLTGQPYTNVMQYTGLKDKNGKEIYEGDILESPLSDSLYIVKWDEDRCGFIAVTTIEDGSEWYEHISEYKTVIGNIYENPELLEERQ